MSHTYERDGTIICPNKDCKAEQLEGLAEDYCLQGPSRIGQWANEDCSECYTTFKARINSNDKVEVAKA